MSDQVKPTDGLNRAQRRAINQRKGTYWHFKKDVMEVISEQASNLAKNALKPAIISRPFEDSEVLALRLSIETAWGSLRAFNATEGAVVLLEQCFQHALIRAESISHELIPSLIAGIAAIDRMRTRAAKGYKLGPDAEALVSVPGAIMIYDEILINSSPLQMDQAKAESERRLANKAGSKP